MPFPVNGRVFAYNYLVIWFLLVVQLHTVNPIDDNALNDSDDKDAETGAVPIHKLKNVHTTLKIKNLTPSIICSMKKISFHFNHDMVITSKIAVFYINITLSILRQI